MDVTSLIFFSKIEGFLYVSQKSTHVSIPGGALYSVMFFMHRCKCGHQTDKRNCGAKKESPFQDYLNKDNFIHLAPEVIVKKVVGPRVVENRDC